MCERIIIRNLTEDDIKCIENGKLFEALSFFQPIHDGLHVNFPIKYIPDYIKETDQYKIFVELIDQNNPESTIIIPEIYIPLEINQEYIDYIENFSIIGLGVYNYWGVNPNYLFEKFPKRLLLRNIFSHTIVEDNCYYLLELWKLIPYNIDSRELFYYFLRNMCDIKDIFFQ